jgi:hypothetical protein|tara:strand:- start:212 stop:628 length:417 start_codon:yes stop_codon:yes gene_type:complete
MPGSERQNNMFDESPVKQYVQDGNPLPVTSCGRRRNTGTPLFKRKRKKGAEPRRTIGKGKNFNKVSKNKKARGGAAGGGMTEKGVREYRRKNPGSKLRTAVTGKNPSKKDAARRKSFCARSRSWKSERGLAARRRWRC